MANTLTHFTCHIHTGAHSVGNYIDETPMESFSFPQVSSAHALAELTVLAQEDENSRWRKRTGSCSSSSALFFLLSSTLRQRLGGPPEWVLSFWVWVWSREGLPQGCFLWESFSPISQSPWDPQAAEDAGVVRGRDKYHSTPLAWPIPLPLTADLTKPLSAHRMLGGCWGMIWGRGASATCQHFKSSPFSFCPHPTAETSTNLLWAAANPSVSGTQLFYLFYLF